MNTSTIKRTLGAITASALLLGPAAALSQAAGAPARTTGPVGVKAPPVPAAVQELRRSYLDPEVSSLTLRRTADIYETRRVTAGGTPWILPRAEAPLAFSYRLGGQTHRADQFPERTYTNALLIIKDGRIVHESYRNRSTEQDRFMGFSMTKSLTSLLVGAALQDGLIASIDDPVTKYVPDLKGGGYDGVSIRHILQMRSGVERNESYDIKDPTSYAPGSPMAALRDNVVRYADAALIVPRGRAPGSTFKYMNLDTAVLGLLIERVSKGSIAGYATTQLWEPLGAEADGHFIMDGPPGVGREFNVAGYNATLRDWGRVGQMMLDGGRANGRQVVAASWVAESVRPTPLTSADKKEPWGYGYQWWTFGGTGAYAMRGHLGQYVFIDPRTRTVIVKLSHFPADKSEATYPEVEAFFTAASAWKPG